MAQAFLDAQNVTTYGAAAGDFVSYPPGSRNALLQLNSVSEIEFGVAGYRESELIESSNPLMFEKNDPFYKRFDPRSYFLSEKFCDCFEENDETPSMLQEAIPIDDVVDYFNMIIDFLEKIPEFVIINEEKRYQGEKYLHPACIWMYQNYVFPYFWSAQLRQFITLYKKLWEQRATKLNSPGCISVKHILETNPLDRAISFQIKSYENAKEKLLMPKSKGELAGWGIAKKHILNLINLFLQRTCMFYNAKLSSNDLFNTYEPRLAELFIIDENRKNYAPKPAHSGAVVTPFSEFKPTNKQTRVALSSLLEATDKQHQEKVEKMKAAAAAKKKKKEEEEKLIQSTLVDAATVEIDTETPPIDTGSPPPIEFSSRKRKSSSPSSSEVSVSSNNGGKTKRVRKEKT